MHERLADQHNFGNKPQKPQKIRLEKQNPEYCECKAIPFVQGASSVKCTLISFKTKSKEKKEHPFYHHLCYAKSAGPMFQVQFLIVFSFSETEITVVASLLPPSRVRSGEKCCESYCKYRLFRRQKSYKLTTSSEKETSNNNKKVTDKPQQSGGASHVETDFMMAKCSERFGFLISVRVLGTAVFNQGKPRKACFYKIE